MITNPTTAYRTPPLFWMLIGIGLALAIFSAFDPLAAMVQRWDNSEEYGYGYMIPVITLFLIWQRKDKLEAIPFTGSWLGVGLLLVGVLTIVVGQMSAINTVAQYGFVIAVIGAVYAVMGWTAFKVVVVPLLLLFLMVPLPSFVFNNLSSQLQLISSQIGVAVIRLFGISVHLEGNVIDLGTYQLQVVEACSGLRYLFPLIALSIIASYFYQAAVWKRVVVILSSMPITVLMNSFRIGVIGVLVEHYGIEQAEGFLHDFEGWIVFMACVLLLVVEIWLLSRFGKDRQPFREVFGMELPAPTPEGAPIVTRVVPRHAFVMIAFLAVGASGAVVIGGRPEQIPERLEFVSFPASFGEWRGRNDTLDSIVLDALNLDDYILADYRNADGKAVNFYVAYYGSQRSGASAHSPRSCLPGGGWRIESSTQVALDNGLQVNRFIIRMGENRQLVYYWFKQRDRIITSEFAVKWYLLWDALARNRTDGALVRLTTVLQPGENAEAGDARLRALAHEIAEPLSQYVPD
ncbi:MAG: VPLPA-CTERM-specific exosortase XrtD [Gammaproteobacteria bacterium]|nr:VPLPA-CTERM-specific exosortase XrtD [Gammaproteobacteria bacterium]